MPEWWKVTPEDNPFGLTEFQMQRVNYYLSNLFEEKIKNAKQTRSRGKNGIWTWRCTVETCVDHLSYGHRKPISYWLAKKYGKKHLWNKHRIHGEPKIVRFTKRQLKEATR